MQAAHHALLPRTEGGEPESSKPFYCCIFVCFCHTRSVRRMFYVLFKTVSICTKDFVVACYRWRKL